MSILRCGLWAALVVVAAVCVKAQDESQLAGYLRVDRAGVQVPVPNRDYLFKVGNAAKLFALEGNCLVVAHTIEDVRANLYAVRWNKYDAPAWISNERLVTFGKLSPTIEGSLSLEQGERLPVEALGEQTYRVAIVRFGITGILDVAKSLPGLLFEAAPEVTAAPKPTVTNTSPAKARFTITGSGTLVSIVTNEPDAPSTVQTTVQPTAMAVVPVPVAVTAEIPVVAPAIDPPVKDAAVPLPATVKWPSLLEDKGNLVVLIVVIVLFAFLFRVARNRMQKTSQKAIVAAPEPAKEESAPKFKPSAPEASGRLRYVPSNVNQTIILNQQHAQASTPAAATGYPTPVPPSYQARPKPQGASATAIIPSPPVLPDRRTGGVLWIGKYAVEQLLGRGRMGVVYKAQQQDLNRSVALKLLAEGGYASEKQKERFVREAQAIAKLRHPNIVMVYEVGEWEGQPYFAMEFIDGKSLDKLVVKQRLSPLDAARLTHKIAVAIDYAHSCGIIHRDLKPGNIIIDGKGEPVITDFGLARHLDEDSANAGDDILGTPAYMSPEQARGRTKETDSRSDVYSTGAILYAMLTGRDPFAGSSLLDTLHKVIHEKPIPPEKLEPDVDLAISAICMKAMAKDPKKRYQTAGELGEDLARYVKVLESGQSPAQVGKTGILGRMFARRS